MTIIVVKDGSYVRDVFLYEGPTTNMRDLRKALEKEHTVRPGETISVLSGNDVTDAVVEPPTKGKKA